MKLNNAPPAMYLNAGSNIILQPVVFAIGAWDMDATVQVSQDIGIGFSSVLQITAIIYNDSNTQGHPLDGREENDEKFKGSIKMSGSTVYLRRADAGFFDNANYNDGVMNRGWILVFRAVP